MKSCSRHVRQVVALAFAFVPLAGCFGAGGGAEPDDWRRYDACQPLRVALETSVTEAQSTAVRAGLALWNDRAATQLTLVAPGSPSDLVMKFQKASLASLGFYDPDAAMIFINAGLTDAHDQAVTVAHETGHALGLPHVPSGARSSVMNPANRTIEPTDDDIAALAELWGPCPQ